MIAAISDDVLISINTIEMVAIVYLALAISKLRSDVAELKGSEEQRRLDNGA